MGRIGWSVVLVAVMGCGDPVDQVDEATLDGILALASDATAGEALYDADCASCHEADGSGGFPYPGIAETPDEDFVAYVIVGPGMMPSAEELGYEDQEIADLLAYVRSL